VSPCAETTVFAPNETFVNRIRILLWGMPPMLLDILTDTIAAQPDMDIVGRGGSDMDLLDAVEQTNADVVVLARGAAVEGEDEDYDKLLYRRCRLKVLELLAEGRCGSLCEMRRHRVALGEMSPARLLEAIRGSADFVAGGRS
jgi:chemotaxis response regulator CheB